MPAQQGAKLVVVIFLVFDDVVEDVDGAVVSEFLELRTVVGDVAAFFDFKTAEGHADAAGAVGEGVSLAVWRAFVDGLGCRPAP